MKSLGKIKCLAVAGSMLLCFSSCVSTMPEEGLNSLHKDDYAVKEIINGPVSTTDQTNKMPEVTKVPETTKSPAAEAATIPTGENTPSPLMTTYDKSVEAGVLVQGTETVKPLPMGTFVETDLDGDGTEEKVTVAFPRQNAAESSKVLERVNTPTLFINDMVFDAEYLENTVGLYMESADMATWYLFDVDTKDGYQEIGLYEAGPSNDPYTTLLRYQEGELRRLGGFSDNPIAEEVDYIDETQDYQAVIDGVDRSQIQIIVPGDGTIYGTQRLDILETNFAEGMWKLLNSESFDEAGLEVQVREVYQFIGFGQREEEYCPKVETSLQLFVKPDVSSEMFDLEAGQIVDFYDYYPIGDGGWVQVVYNNYKSVGWIFVKDHFDIYQLNEEGEGVYIPSYNLFKDLNMAD